jgi:hypothetical protein
MIWPTVPFGEIIDKDGNPSAEMILFMSQLIQLLNQQLGTKGIFLVPRHTTAEIADLIAKNELNNGTIIYDSTTNQFKGYEGGTLKTFTLV